MRRVLVTSCGSFALAAQATASVVIYVNDQAGWNAAVGSVTSIGFVDPPTAPDGLIAPDLYGQFGVTLATTHPLAGVYATTASAPVYTDGFAIAALFPYKLAFDFAQPIQGFGYHAYFPVTLLTPAVTFWHEGVVVGQSSILLSQTSGNVFLGWTTDFLFDRVETNMGIIDNIHFQAVPAPGVLAGLGCAAAALRGRRRSGHLG